MQALQFELVQYLLDLLNGTLKVENPAGTKAQIVKALKAMIRDLTHGTEVKKLFSFFGMKLAMTMTEPKTATATSTSQMNYLIG